MLPPAAQEVFWKALAHPAPGPPLEVFAVLDGGRVQELQNYPAKWDEDVPFACLLAGESDPLELMRAPYLVRVVRGSNTARWLLSDAWDKSCGVFLACAAGTELDTVLQDIREVLDARLPDGRLVKFRFYDPRIWRPFFPTCDAGQLKVLFGRAVKAFGCEDAGGGALLLDTRDLGEPRRVPYTMPL